MAKHKIEKISTKDKFENYGFFCTILYNGISHIEYWISNIEESVFFFSNNNIHRVSNTRKWILNIRNLFLVIKNNGILFY